ncbi:MAG: hypothetical protein NWE81_03905 [Candidatus Bathyarchaeota archaeon]|jgi:hypothetical protein|nr:hypothetical protein [Candidatus Bathyarchaeota archaeon]
MKEEYGESETSTLQGQEAAESLRKLIEEIEKGELEELTFRQAWTIAKVAKILIAAIDQEDTTVWATLRHSGSLAKLRNIMTKLIERITESHPESVGEPSILEKDAFELDARRCDR